MKNIGPHQPEMVYDPNQGGMVRPGLSILVARLRLIFDKAADAHHGDYPGKVNAGLLAVYDAASIAKTRQTGGE